MPTPEPTPLADALQRLEAQAQAHEVLATALALLRLTQAQQQEIQQLRLDNARLATALADALAQRAVLQ
jgi:hypothetical protein